MLIIYVAKHFSGGNDDEGAIAHALHALGHQVIAVDERRADHKLEKLHGTGDLLLFHHWSHAGALARVDWLPKVFWYFDLVTYPGDPELEARNAARAMWMRTMTPLVDVGFCTDGDWVRQDDSGKLVRLTQGADERVVGRGTSARARVPVLFVGGTRGCGTGREQFVTRMKRKYTTMFRHIEQRVHGPELANAVATARLVVAPDHPVTDHYWSNRVYLMCGFGACLLHPYSATLADHYQDGEEILYYHSLGHMDELIREYLPKPNDRVRIGNAALERTLTEHTYRIRLVQMLQELRARGIIKSDSAEEETYDA